MVPPSKERINAISELWDFLYERSFALFYIISFHFLCDVWTTLWYKKICPMNDPLKARVSPLILPFFFLPKGLIQRLTTYRSPPHFGPLCPIFYYILLKIF
jgi:hypothetical protein